MAHFLTKNLGISFNQAAVEMRGRSRVPMSRFGACQNGRICRGRVVVSAPLGFGARLDSHGWVHVPQAAP